MMRKNTSSHHLRGADFVQPGPRVRKKRVSGANLLARLRRGQPDSSQPGGLLGQKPRVERSLRHPGLLTISENAPRRGAWIFTIIFFLYGMSGFGQTTS